MRRHDSKKNLIYICARTTDEENQAIQNNFAEKQRLQGLLGSSETVWDWKIVDTVNAESRKILQGQD